uniref:tail fiber protein n=1 Tax=Yersinia rohdei TaxID=29485 RepID=UPI0011A04543
MANEILPFGLGAESNVMAQADYDALAARSGGFASGVAKSEQLNKVWRQSAFVASVLAQFIANRSAHDVLDDGDTATLLTNLELAIKTYANASLPAASTTIAGITQLSSLTNSNSEVLAATPKAIKAVSDATLKIASNLAEIAATGPAAVAATRANIDVYSKSEVNARIPYGVPTGSILQLAGTTAPAGTLLCPTSATNVSRTTYAALFA